MRSVPFLVTTCNQCGKQLYLWSEDDFHATIDSKDHKTFYYTCPECGAIEKQPECFLPTYLKEKLVQDAMKKKMLTNFIFICFGILAFSIGLFVFLFR